MNRSAKTVLVATVLGLATTSAFAETWWERATIRVADRLENQDRRINREYREGDISYWHARRLHQEDRTIRNGERAMAGFDHDHISRPRGARAQPTGERRLGTDRPLITGAPPRLSLRRRGGGRKRGTRRPSRRPSRPTPKVTPLTISCRRAREAVW